MPIARYITNADVIKRAGVEVGLPPDLDAFASVDPSYIQLVALLTTAAQEMMEMFPWQILTREFQYTTVFGESGKLPLPDDFAYMIDQTGWERNENVPLMGPLSPQEWTYLLGRDLVSSTIYASFRFDQNEFWIFPNDPAPADLDINFEYISRNLFAKSQDFSPTGEFIDVAESAGDFCLFPPNLIKNYLKVKFLEAKGFDSQKAEDNFWRAFYSWTGKDQSAKILNAGSAWRGIPYLNAWRNVPDTGFGGI
jgi:hypothetical protein